MLRRYQDWPARLDRFVKAASERPFSWGTADCALLACDWVREATGTDPATSLRGTYSCALGAARACRKFAGGDLEAVAERIAVDLGQPEIPVSMAQRGDLVIARPDGQPALGVCIGAKAIFAGPEGVERIDMRDCSRAWRI